MIQFLELPTGWEQCKVASGSYCYILAGPEIEALLLLKYGRQKLCLKVFETPDINDIEHLEIEPIIEKARIQNIFALFGIAPVVYRIVFLSIRRVALVVEYETGAGEPDPYLAHTLVKKFNLRSRNVTSAESNVEKFDFLTTVNWVGDKYVDFGGWYFGQ